MEMNYTAAHISLGPKRRIKLVTTRQVLAVAESEPPVSGPACAAAVLTRLIGDQDREHFVVLHLSAAHRIVAAETVSVGTLNETPAHPREIFKGAILANAKAIICGHNHPSGQLLPSAEDRETAKKLAAVGELMGLPVLDFVIVTNSAYFSFEEQCGAWR